MAHDTRRDLSRHDAAGAVGHLDRATDAVEYSSSGANACLTVPNARSMVAVSVGAPSRWGRVLDADRIVRLPGDELDALEPRRG